MVVSLTALACLIGQAALADENPPLAALGSTPVPEHNPMTPEKIDLGRLLFFDPRLSGDASLSCAGCHDPGQGWSFSTDISRGYPGTIHWRNSLSLINSAYYNKLDWAGDKTSLEAQAAGAASGAVAGNGEADMMEARLAFIPEYRARFQDVFGDIWPQLDNAWKAIAAFERTLVQTDTPFDRFMRGEEDALTDAQQRGLALFNGRANCIECHNGPLLSDQKYYNIGVPRAARWLDDGLAQITFRYEQFAKGVTEELYRTLKDDAGLYYRTKQLNDQGKFRTPTLRYSAYTAPYMHNGAFNDLRQVVEFYNAGGGENEFLANKTVLMRPLGLSPAEVDDLVALLESFSGPEIAMEPPALPDYAPLPAATE
jgi:cytochrome c peroxidase